MHKQNPSFFLISWTHTVGVFKLGITAGKKLFPISLCRQVCVRKPCFNSRHQVMVITHNSRKYCSKPFITATSPLVPQGTREHTKLWNTHRALHTILLKGMDTHIFEWAVRFSPLWNQQQTVSKSAANKSDSCKSRECWSRGFHFISLLNNTKPHHYILLTLQENPTEAAQLALLPLTLQVSCTSSLQWDIHLQYLLHSFFPVWKNTVIFLLTVTRLHIRYLGVQNPWRIKVEKLYLGLSFQELPYSNVHTHTVLNLQFFNEVTSNMKTALFCREKKKSVRGSKVFWKL